MDKIQQHNPSKYSYRENGEVVITDVGEQKIEELEADIADLQMEVDVYQESDKVEHQIRAGGLTHTISQKARMRARIKRGDPIAYPWDNEFAIQTHLYILNSMTDRAPSAKVTIESVGTQMDKPKDFIAQVGERKYHKSYFNELIRRLEQHPLWINMVEFGTTDKNDLSHKDCLRSQLVTLGKKRDHYYYCKENRARIIDLERRQMESDYQIARQQILLDTISKEGGYNIDQDEVDIQAYHEIGMSVRDIAKETGHSKSKIHRILSK